MVEEFQNQYHKQTTPTFLDCADAKIPMVAFREIGRNRCVWERLFEVQFYLMM